MTTIVLSGSIVACDQKSPPTPIEQSTEQQTQRSAPTISPVPSSAVKPGASLPTPETEEQPDRSPSEPAAPPQPATRS